MASKLPKSEKEFLSVEGVGSVKADKYAGQFLPVIQEFLSSKKNKSRNSDLEQQDYDSISNSSVHSSYLESAEYAEQGLTPYEIAIERGLTETAILNHLTQAAEEGNLEEFDADVHQSRKKSIKEAFQKIGTETLKAVKEFLADEITYDEIRYVLIEYLVKGN
jgi:Superfamily II DNA helicase